MKVTCQNPGCRYYIPGKKGGCSRENIIIGEKGCETFARGHRYYTKKAWDAMNEQGVIPLDELTRDVEIGADFIRRIHRLTAGTTDGGLYFHNGSDRAMSKDAIRSAPWDDDENMRIIAEVENDLLDEKYPQNDTGKIMYGWLAPDGTFTQAPFGEHETAAYQIIRISGWLEGYEAWEETRAYGTAREYLADEKGFVLIHDVYGDSGYADALQPLTDRQKEYLYNYYISTGDMFKAALYAE